MIAESTFAATTPISLFDSSTTFLGTFIFDELANIGQKITNTFKILAKKQNVKLTEYDYKKLEIAVLKLKHATDDMLFANDGRALQLSMDDAIINILGAEELMRHMAQSYNFEKYSFILQEIGIPAEIIKMIDQKRREYTIKNRHDPYAQTRKWFRRIAIRFRMFVTCVSCGFVNEVRDMSLIESQVPADEVFNP